LSKIALSGNNSGTGTFTLASPNSSTDRTLDLPDASGVIDRLNRAGNVLQVVQNTVATETLFTSASYVDALTVSITPSSASNKVLIITSILGQANGSTTTAGLRVARDSTAIATFAEWVRSSNYGGGAGQMTSSLNILDSPNTTSAITYRLQVARTSGSDNCFYSVSSSITTIIAMEIAG